MKMDRTLFVLLILVVFASSLRAESITQKQTSGPVQIVLTIDPKEPVIGDTVTLKIEATAEKDVELLMPDFGEALDRFAIIDFAPREKVTSDGKTIATQTYRLDPPASGRQVIPPILIEYVDRRDGQRLAPEGLDAYEVLTDRIPFEVASVLADDAKLDLRPPMGELDPLPTLGRSLWWLYLLPVLLCVIATPFLWKAYLRAKARGRRRSAYDVAQAKLRRLLQNHPGTVGQMDAFYVELSSIVRRYIEDRFEMRAPELTTEEFMLSIGQSPDFSADHQGLLRDFLRQADLVKFARAEPSDDDTRQAIEKTQQFLEETREDAPLIEVDEEPPAAESKEAVHG